MSENPIRDAIQEAIAEHEVILFMKGTPERPHVRLLRAHRRRRWRRSAPSTRPSTSCPTRASARSCPRSPTGRRSRSCSCSGELVGGCDIVTEMYETRRAGPGARRRAAAAGEAARAAEPGAPLQIENRLS